jgi:anti-anti-sigma factor
MPSQTSHRYLHTIRAGEVMVVRFTNHKILAEATVEAVAKGLLALADEPGPRKVVVDLAAVESLNSSVIATLVNLQRRLKAHKGQLALCMPRPRIADVLKTLRLSRLLNVHDTEEEAVQYLRGSP